MHRRHWMGSIAATMAVVGIVLPVRPTVVLGHSMSPTLRSGSVHLVATRFYRSHPLRRGDVVVFHYQGETCTKRVYALPGDHLFLLRDDDGGADELLDAAEARAIQR